MNRKKRSKGSSCGSDGRAVASDSRGPRFESSHWQKFKLNIFTGNCIEKTKIKKKRPGLDHFFKKRREAIKKINNSMKAFRVQKVQMLGFLFMEICVLDLGKPGL